jgi:hypothetical protein
MRGERGSEVFMLRDLIAILRGVAVATEAALHVTGGNADYTAGQRATLAAVATALGIPAHELRPGMGGNT